ncbi:uncharacterized protein LOC129944566 [Eupeodes corollae]|uniref:uncharacterized protein LOC129944566 n=1 Tax=Eupeodes corollae TaxID=290404 RepID=UPI0024913063|nr:uncharacterized protein LOC129944566 [Eupeodes corollae]
MLIFYPGVLMVLYIKTVNSSFFFPSNSAYGIFAALAVPLDLGPHRNVFVSYNFEANYNLPVNWQLPTYLEFGDTRLMKDQIRAKNKKNPIASSTELNKVASQDIIQYVKGDNSTNQKFIMFETSDDVNATEHLPREEESNEENEKNKSRERRSLLSRKMFYNILTQRFQMYGYNGRSCLLRLICETNASRIGENNGFLGSVIHIIFTPSSSKNDKLSKAYYRAEIDGEQGGCQKYWKECPDNIFDFISTPVHDIIKSLRIN